MEQHGLSVADTFEESCDRYPTKDAVVYVNTKARYTFTQLDQGVVPVSRCRCLCVAVSSLAARRCCCTMQAQIEWYDIVEAESLFHAVVQTGCEFNRPK